MRCTMWNKQHQETEMSKREKSIKKGKKMTNGTAGAGPSPCKPFSVNLAVLSPNDQTQVSFGISRHCPPTGPLYIIIFVLRTSEPGGFQDRVKLEVTLGDTDNPDAQA